jgi:hypothetical protein
LKVRRRATKATVRCGFNSESPDFQQIVAASPAELGLLVPARMSADVVIGRTLACCVHPAAAWRRVSKAGKAVILGAYFVVGYLGVLAVLLAK